jgi:hypothetical protein
MDEKVIPSDHVISNKGSFSKEVSRILVYVTQKSPNSGLSISGPGVQVYY